VIAGQLNERTLQGYLEGLRCLHELGFVHCDIEPRHLCMSAEGCPAIIDLGERPELGCQQQQSQKSLDLQRYSMHPPGATYLSILQQLQIRLLCDICNVLRVAKVSNVVRSYLGYLHVQQNPFMQFVAACSCQADSATLYCSFHLDAAAVLYRFSL